jgi:hypothetical protein
MTALRRIRAWPYWDAPLAAFVLVMVAAATITSHGTYVFYRYILPAELALAATLVLTLGIPLLELAAVLDRPQRGRYVTGMVVLLVMEAAAQYLQGQAHFVTRVLAQFPSPDGVDLAWFAQLPWGRLLPILYLALLSIVVVYFGYAASARIRDLRVNALKHAQQAESLAQLEVAVAQRDVQLMPLRANLATLEETIAQQDAQLAQLRADQATLEERIAQQNQSSAAEVAHLEAIIAQRDAEVAQLAGELAQFHDGAVQPSHGTDLDLLAIAQALREGRERSWRDVEELLHVPQSTLRSRLAKIAQNGSARAVLDTALASDHLHTEA